MFKSRFTIHDTALKGVKVVERKPVGDDRGYLGRLYCRDELAEAGFDQPIVQINHTLTRRRGSVRGMHFQYPPVAEDKFVSVLRGAVLDVAVDLRAMSSTLLRWHGECLSADNNKSLFIPKGFAHGFQTLTEDCELIYLHTAPYVAAKEGALNALDPSLGIKWPIPVVDLSNRDRSHTEIDADFRGLTL